MMESRIKRTMRRIFDKQFPGCVYSLRNFYIENWPEDVDLLKEHWTNKELAEINGKMPSFIFRYRDEQMTLDRQFDLHKFTCLTEAELDTSMSYKDVTNFIHERFRTESGPLEAIRVDWRLLDRSRIPDKYSQVPLNSFSIQCKLIQFNREIIENIHFHRAK